VHYFTSWQERIGNSFFLGLGEAIQATLKAAPKDAPITITGNSVYTSTLFFATPRPTEYIATVGIPDPTSPFQTVENFGRFKFGIHPEEFSKQAYWVAHISELSNFNLLTYDVKTFGNYAAVTRKAPETLMCYRQLEVWDLKGHQDLSTLAVDHEVDSTEIGLPIADQRFSRGFGVHGDSDWSLRLNEPAESLEIGMGLASGGGCSEGLRFKILLDDKEAFDSKRMKPGQLKFTKIALQNVKKISFITEAGMSNRCDHGLWITPVIKHCPNK
jgi:hypothetical protein